jgi:hypothetical protein
MTIAGKFDGLCHVAHHIEFREVARAARPAESRFISTLLRHLDSGRKLFAAASNHFLFPRRARMTSKLASASNPTTQRSAVTN